MVLLHLNLAKSSGLTSPHYSQYGYYANVSLAHPSASISIQ